MPSRVKTVASNQPGINGHVTCLVSVLQKEKTEKLTNAVNEIATGFHFSGIAFGTAGNNYLSYLGLDEIEKRMTISLLPESCIKQVLANMNKKLELFIPGNGIAFTVPLSTISSIVENRILNSDIPQKNTFKEKKSMHELIVAVVNQKYTDTLISSAKEAGATGATILHTLSTGNEQFEQKLGADLRRETDTVFILTAKNFRTKIMESIRDSAGLQTEGGAILFSVPINELVGIGKFEENEGRETK